MQKNTTIAQTTVNSTKSTKRILIVGGGYVGFYAYKAIMKKAKHLVRSGAVSITVVDPLSSHSFHGFSGETVGGIISEDARRSPFRKIFADARFIRGYATNINEIEKRVEVRTTDGESTTSLGYDHLILGVGVGDDLDSVPGIREHGLTLRGSGGPDGLRATVLERLEQATVTSNPDLREKLLSFVVAGGGFTGVEIAAAIAAGAPSVMGQTNAMRLTDPALLDVVGAVNALPEW